MKQYKYLVVLLAILGSVFYYACDDSGVIPIVVTAGEVKFSQSSNLRVLDPANDGLYYLWIQLADTTGLTRWRTLAVFNVTASGSLVDASGNPVTPVVSPLDTVDIERASTCLVTIQQSVSAEPGNTRILGGTFSVYLDSVSTAITFNSPLALGSVGDTLMRQGTSRLYIINTPTNSEINCEKGVWFCDTLGNSYLPNIPLNPGGGWQYRGWVYDRISQQYTTTGAFYNPLAQDFDGAGNCAGSTTLTYNAPGQDWVSVGCLQNINMLDGNHELFLVIEPEGRTETVPPFNFKIYYQPNIVPSLQCKRIDNVFGQSQNVPSARIRITRARGG
jgi:hypothetical protein